MWQNTRIFKYNVGEQDVFGDPLEIHNDLTEALGGDVNKTLAEAHHGEPSVSCPAHRKLIPAIRHAFMVAPFDPITGNGATWEICIDLLNRFIDWEKTQKKTGEQEPMPSSDAAGSTSSNCPTSTSSGSGLTSNAPTGAIPPTSSVA
jgi:hypothetical protein